MSSINNDSNAIDEKKNQASTDGASDYASKLRSFFISFGITFGVVLFYFACGGFALMLCKVAQVNILPTEPSCFPYTDQEATVRPTATNIFTTGIFTDPEMSMKLTIPGDHENMNFRILDAMREYKAKPSSNFLANYFISIIESMLQMNYSTINVIMDQVNGLPEFLIVLLGPLINAIVFGLGLVINFLYFIYLYFANMGWFFKTNTNISGNGPPVWEDVTLLRPVDWWLALGMVLLFIVVFIFGLPLGLGFIPLLAVCYCTVSCMLFKGKLNGERPITLLGIITGVLLHYKVTIVSIMSVVIVSLAFSDLGTSQGLLAMVVACLVYYGVVRFNTFIPIKESDLSPMVSNDQAKKVCRRQTSRHPNVDLDLLQAGGGITKYLKRLNKRLKKN